MLEFYSLFLLATLMNAANSNYLQKKYQLTAGTSMQASCIFLIINGVVSALVPVIVMIVQGNKLQYTPYSILIALIIVSCSAGATVAHLKAYEVGNIATVNVLSTIGNIILSCAWGIVMLGETISTVGIIAICMMLVSTVIIKSGSSDRSGKRLFWLCVIVILCNGASSILSKQHQVEAAFSTVDTLSFSVWIGVVRTVLFTVLVIASLVKSGSRFKAISKSAVGYAVSVSVISGSSYIITLFTATVLPIVVTSPLGTGISIIMSTLLPWIIYREKISKKQLIGIGFSFIGAMLFLLG